MTNDDEAPESLRFDETKSFSENCRAFLASLEKVDADMAAILRDNWDALVAVVRDGERDSTARGNFNAAVALALDLLVKPAEQKGGE